MSKSSTGTPSNRPAAPAVEARNRLGLPSATVCGYDFHEVKTGTRGDEAVHRRTADAAAPVVRSLRLALSADAPHASSGRSGASMPRGVTVVSRDFASFSR